MSDQSFSTTPELTVIVPVHNTETYVTECLASLSNQDGICIEILVVDDGSTDQSVKKVQDFADQDPRYRLIRQPHLGQSAARNTGLVEAKGDYVLFLDSDDFAMTDTLSTVYKDAKASHSDVHCFRSIFFRSDEWNQNETLSPSRMIRPPHNVSTGRQTLRYLALRGTWQPSATQYLLRRKFLIEQSIQFEPGVFYEDNLFTFDILVAASVVSWTDLPTVAVRIRHDSTTRQVPTYTHVADLHRVRALISERAQTLPRQIRRSHFFELAYVRQNIASQVNRVAKRFRAGQSSSREETQTMKKVRKIARNNLALLFMLSAITKPIRWFARLGMSERQREERYLSS